MGAYPKHRIIADELRNQINAGDFSPANKLPSEADLCKFHRASRTTIRDALKILANEGLLTGESGRGWFVRQRRYLIYRPQTVFRPRAPGLDPKLCRFVADRVAEGRQASQTIEVAIVTPPADVAERLELPPDAVTVVRRRVRTVDGELYYINDSYFPWDLVQGSAITLPNDIVRGANAVLTSLGYEQTKVRDEVFIRMPNPDEAHRLRLGPGTPVGVHVLTGTTVTGKPVRVAVNVLPGDRHVIVWDRERGVAGDGS